VSGNWFLDFGILVHKGIELHYKNFRLPDYDPVAFLTPKLIDMWRENVMDMHSEHKEFKLIGGMHGFIGLVIQYALEMSAENERLRIIGTEVAFGKNYEVNLGEISDNGVNKVEVYLSGRMDVIVDDGYFICPMDHKTMSKRSFNMNPILRYETDEGPTGYIFALASILPNFLSDDEILRRDCTKIIMNFICKDPSVEGSRFKRVALRKTSEQLNNYKHRMLSTILKIMDDLSVNIKADLPFTRNTHVCQNWMHTQCTFFDVCRQASKDGEAATLANGFVKVKLWDTETIGEEG
jgi:hypothetical protein